MPLHCLSLRFPNTFLASMIGRSLDNRTRLDSYEQASPIVNRSCRFNSPVETCLARNPPPLKEDFGKRNKPGKRARRHFSQLSEFETGLIIGMKTAGWSTRHVAGHLDRSECAVRNCWEQWTQEGTHVRKTGSGATRKTTRREDRRIVR
ncbi:uncharacterized protein TNCV_1259261 [Trichonephila clavipes]|nr:uncharacterized protein TNCV_1259261 [Trichonephila clavipes]